MEQLNSTDTLTLDAYAPAQIADRVCKIGLAKVTTPVPTTIALALLAGAFISLGALFYTVTVTTGNDVAVPFGLLRLAGGLTFSLGLVLVVVGGAELFTGNNLIAMAWAVGCVRTSQVVKNWLWVYIGNLIGAVGTAALVLLAGVQTLGGGAVGETMIQIARSKIRSTRSRRWPVASSAMCWSVWLSGCAWERGASRTRSSRFSSPSAPSSPVDSSTPSPICISFRSASCWQPAVQPRFQFSGH